MTTPAYIQLQRWWSQDGEDMETEGISNHRILELEQRYKLVLPDDFRDYLSLSCPIEQGWDCETTSWWNFERIKNIPEEFQGDLEPFIADGGSKYLIFADYSIWCWAWAISCAADETYGKVAMIAGRGYDRLVADSFLDFVQKYISDVRSVC